MAGSALLAKNTNATERENISLRYQVLSPETALYLGEIPVKMAKNTAPVRQPDFEELINVKF